MTLPAELRAEADSLQYAHALPEKTRALLHRAADALEWISVADRLPAYGVPVIVGWSRAPWRTEPTPFIFPHAVCRDDAGDDTWAWYEWDGEPLPVGDDCEWDADGQPTHWRPLALGTPLPATPEGFRYK